MITVIFDLDGTLAKIDERRALAMASGKMDWDVFFDPKNIQLDRPNVPVILAFQAMKAAGYRVGIFSGRSAVSDLTSRDWLRANGVVPDFFKMRPKGSYTPDDVLKKEWLDQEIANGHQILCVYDDRDKVVEMWRKNGIACFQVANGDF